MRTLIELPLIQYLGKTSTLLVLMLLLVSCANGQTAAAEKLDFRLAALANCITQHASAVQCEKAPPNLMRFDNTGRVQVDVSYPCADTAPLDSVQREGLLVVTKVHVPPTCIIEGWIALERLRALAALDEVSSVALPSYAEYQR